MNNESGDENEKNTSARLCVEHGASAESRAPNAQTFSFEECVRLATQEYDAHVNYAAVLMAYLDEVMASG